MIIDGTIILDNQQNFEILNQGQKTGMAFIIVEKGDPGLTGKRFSLGESPVLIGRGTEFKPDISLQDTCVSRRHAEIRFDRDHFVVRDLKSTNGTTIDGVLMEPGKFYPLKNDSVIGLCVTSGLETRISLRFKESSTVSTTRISPTVVNDVNPVDWIRIDKEKCEIWVDDYQISVSKKEYALMLYLYVKLGKVCQRDELIAGVWPEVANAAGVSDAAIDQLIHRLRLKIESDPAHPKHLISRKGFGYKLI
jgi:pSer/pThr/pTyr-binding forkhead associated (FHA) protein